MIYSNYFKFKGQMDCWINCLIRNCWFHLLKVVARWMHEWAEAWRCGSFLLEHVGVSWSVSCLTMFLWVYIRYLKICLADLEWCLAWCRCVSVEHVQVFGSLQFWPCRLRPHIWYVESNGSIGTAEPGQVHECNRLTWGVCLVEELAHVVFLILWLYIIIYCI